MGNRTGKYLHYFSLHPDVVELVAVVEPDPVRQEACRKQFSLSGDCCFTSSDEFFDRFRGPCDGVIIGSPDRCHHAQALKAIDRECGLTPYYILKRYLGGTTAGFWQGVAKVFKGNLKQPYDKYGEDKDLEELVGYWERGQFDSLYEMIFGKHRPDIYIPERFR